MATHRLLIVGGSSGFGLALTQVALEARHYVVTTSRNSIKAAVTHPDISKLGWSLVRFRMLVYPIVKAKYNSV